MTYAYWCTYSDGGSIARAKIKITEGMRTLIKQLNTCLQMATVVADEHVTKHVANLKKNDIHRPATLHEE